MGVLGGVPVGLLDFRGQEVPALGGKGEGEPLGFNRGGPPLARGTRPTAGTWDPGTPGFWIPGLVIDIEVQLPLEAVYDVLVGQYLQLGHGS